MGFGRGRDQCHGHGRWLELFCALVAGAAENLLSQRCERPEECMTRNLILLLRAISFV